MVVNEIGVDFRKAYSVPLTTENIIHRIYVCVIQKQDPEGSLGGMTGRGEILNFPTS